jgi:hypothetical protein
MAHKLEAGTPVFSTIPIPPKQRLWANLERMEQETDPTGFCRGIPMPLALWAHRAGAAVADSGTVEHTKTAIRFAALLRGTQCLALWTVQHAVGLE